MSSSFQFPKRLGRRQTKRGSGRFVIVHWDRETIDFQVCSAKSKQLPHKNLGCIPWTQHAHPLAALAEHFRSESIQAQRLVVLLTRPMLDVLTVSLPAADDAEVPLLVANEVEQQLGDAEEPPAIDYYLLPPTKGASKGAASVGDLEATDGEEVAAEAASVGVNALVFSMTAAELTKLKDTANEHGFRLSAVCPRHLAPLGVLSRRHTPADALSVSVHLYANEAELILCQGIEPLFLRSLRVNPDSIEKTVEQLSVEVQRCATLLPAEKVGANLVWNIFTTCDAARNLAESLKSLENADVQSVNPLLGWELDDASRDAAADKNGDGQESLRGDKNQSSAANSGAAWDFQNDALRVNLLEPKKAPPAPNPALRWGAIGAAAVLVAAVAVYFLLSDVQKLRTEVLALEEDLQGKEKVAAKYAEKADQVALVEDWLSDRVDWLNELDELSDRLPKGNQATVRRLTASTGGNMALIDLSVQVAEQDDVSNLESRIRSVKYAVSSKRISQKADSAEYPWRFETRIEFPIETSQLDSVQSEDYQPPQRPSDNVLGMPADAGDKADSDAPIESPPGKSMETPEESQSVVEESLAEIESFPTEGPGELATPGESASSGNEVPR